LSYLVKHAGGEVLSGGGLAAAADGLVPHHGLLVRVLVGARAAHHGGDLGKALRRDGDEGVVDAVDPVGGGDVAESGAVHEQGQVLGVRERGDHRGVVVAKGKRGDLRVDVEERVTIDVGEVVALGVLVVSEEVNSSRLGNLVHLGEEVLRLRARHGCGKDLGGGGLVGVIRNQGRGHGRASGGGEGTERGRSRGNGGLGDDAAKRLHRTMWYSR